MKVLSLFDGISCGMIALERAGIKVDKDAIIEDKYFKPTQTEFVRLQTLPDGYTNILSKRKAVFAIGNGWTVDVIAHIFKGLK